MNIPFLSNSVSIPEFILWIVYVVTVIGTLLVVVSENRNPIRTLAWVLVLVFLPAVGIVFFYFFGQNNRKKKAVSINYKKLSKDISFEGLFDKHPPKVQPNYETLSVLLERNSNALLLQGSRVEVITHGHRKFELLLEDIEKASHHIHMEYFIFQNDTTGKKIKEALMRKAAEGVEVRFLYDNVANTRVPPSFYKEMRRAGVIVSPFLKVFLPWLRSKVNYRNHRKVVVIDGKIGYIGGMNVGDTYAMSPIWRDTHLRIEGKGVYGLQANFLLDWYSSGEKKVDNYVSYFPYCPNYSNNLLQIVPGGPDSAWPNLLQATVRLVILAKHYLYIQTPYFLPTDSLFQTLISAALAGVDVRLMVSRKSDSSYVDPAAKSYYAELLRAGLKIYEHQQDFIHAKTIVSDDYLSVIGSANMDFRSFESNFEINCYLYDTEIARKNKAVFLEDMKGCSEILLDEWEQRPWWKKMIESVMRLFAPLF